MSSTDFDLLSLFAPEIWALKVLGFWKSEDNNSVYNSFAYKSYRGLVWFGMATFQLLGYMLVFQKGRDISIGDVSSVLFLYTTIFNVQTASISIFVNMDRLHTILHLLASDILQLKEERYVLMAERLKKSGDFMRKYYYALLVFVLVVQPAVKLARKDKEPFYASYIPPALGHIGLLVFQEIMMAIVGYAGSSVIILDVNLLIGISIQIEALKNTLRELDDINVILECIKRYEHIVRLANNAQHIISIGMTTHFLTGVLLFCTTLYKICRMMVGLSEFVFILPYSTGIILVIFIHCWFGNDIIYRSASITNAIFDSKWIGAKVPMQKTVILFMTLTKDPLAIHMAGGLLTMAIPLFVSICRTAYSAFTILQKFG